jgi:hypothetical protein
MFRKAVAPGPVAAVFALAAASYMLAGGSNFCLDDAWIHLSYAKSLRLGDGLSYNPGDHATGFSSPLWVLLLAALPWGSDPVFPVKLLGALCHAAAAWGCAKLAELVVRERAVQPSAAGFGGAGASTRHAPANSNAAAVLAADSALKSNAVASQNFAAAADPQIWDPGTHTTAARVAAQHAPRATTESIAPAALTQLGAQLSAAGSTTAARVAWQHARHAVANPAAAVVAEPVALHSSTGSAAAAAVVEQSSPLAETESTALRNFSKQDSASDNAGAASMAVVTEPVALHASTSSTIAAVVVEQSSSLAETGSTAVRRFSRRGGVSGEDGAASIAIVAEPVAVHASTSSTITAVVVEQRSPLAETESTAIRGFSKQGGASGQVGGDTAGVVAQRLAPVAETSSTAAAIASDNASRLLPPFVAGIICAIDPGLTFSAVSGMEVSLTAALLVWGACAVLSGRPVLAAALAACAVWARPESLFFIGAWSVLRFAASRTRAQLLPLAAAIGALLVWMGYCALVSGYPFPNTYYAKREALVGRGLLLFVLEYLPAHGWVACLTGLVLLVVAVSRPGETRRLVLAWFVACLAIAATRKLIPNTQFYSWRYFAVFAVIPCVAMACALRVLLERRWLVVCALAPIALTSVWMLPSARTLQRAQELDIRLVHTDPAKWLATVMPPDARLLVEGAGATRFFLPRTAQVIDAVGLNLASVVHARGQARVCEALRLAPTHVLLPDDFFGLYRQVLQLETMKTFIDPEYRIVRVPVVQRVWAARALKIKPAARAVCATL